MRVSFLHDFCMLIGIITIIRPKFLKKEKENNPFLRTLSDEERLENKLNTEKMFKLI